MKQPISEETLSLLAKYDTPTICNVIELFNLRPRTQGYANGNLIAGFSHLPPMVGFAVTVTYSAKTPPDSGKSYTSLDKQIKSFNDFPAPRIVVCQDIDQPPVAACFGEMLATVYMNSGCVGLVTSGAGRDVEQIRKLNFPVFTTATICSHGYGQFMDLNVPVEICGLQIQPGDLLHADANGVTTIPLSFATQIGKYCKGFLEAEEEVFEALSQGGGNPETLTQSFHLYQTRLEALKSPIKSQNV